MIDGLKFDLRIYLLVAGCSPLRLYIYKEGLARFATKAYVAPNKKNLSSLFTHLTNYAINKHSPDFKPGNNAKVDEDDDRDGEEEQDYPGESLDESESTQKAGPGETLAKN